MFFVVVVHRFSLILDVFLLVWVAGFGVEPFDVLPFVGFDTCIAHLLQLSPGDRLTAYVHVIRVDEQGARVTVLLLG